MHRRTFLKSSALGAGAVGIGLPAFAESVVPSKPSASYCLLPAHEVPVIADVDVLIVGGTSGAVAAAVEARKSGASVFLAAPMPYLGEDICGTLRLWPEDVQPIAPLTKRLFSGNGPSFPLHVKTVLEDELLLHDIPFLYSSYCADLLYTTDGKAAGALIVNRSGCQAIRAKTVADATLDATTIRSGNLLTSPGSGNIRYEFTVVGNGPKTNQRIVESKEMSGVIKVGNKTFTARRFTFEFPDAGNDYAALCDIEQQIRDITWDPDQTDSSDLLTYVPSQHIKSVGASTSDVDPEKIPLQAFQPQDITNLYVLSGHADVSRETARRLLRPVSLSETGMRVGKAAAEQAKGLSAPKIADIRTTKGKTVKGAAREIALPLRASGKKETLKVSDIYLPVAGEYDMAVLGGGTAGAPAGIGASRQGIRTVTLEYLHGMGGIMTNGLIGRYWDGFREGFTKEVDNGVCAIAPADHPRQKKKCDTEWCADWKMEWFRRETRKAGGDIRFGVMGCGAVVDGNRVVGIVTATPFGRSVILAKTTADSTGSGDIAIAAGAAYDYTGKYTVAVQGAGLSRHNPDDFYNNNDWTFIDDSDVLDISRVFVAAKAKYKVAYDLCKIPQTRERRRIIAEHIVSVLDVINGRRYPDTLSYHTSSFDTHGYTVDPYFTLRPPERRHKIYNADVPLRTLLPKGLDGIIVTGLGTGAHRDAMPVIRMQPCLQNQGYAVGYLVATAVKTKKDIRTTDIKKVQQFLVGIGNLPDRVLTDKDNFPFPNARFTEAAASLSSDMEGLEILLTDTHRAVPLLKQHLQQKAGTRDAINYAHTLAMLGETVGMQTVIDEVNSFTEWDEGWPYTGMGQFGPCMSRLDSLIMALGATRRTEALPAIIAHAERLTLVHNFSHFRAISVAFETIADKSAAPVLYKLLQIPGIRNTPVVDYQIARIGTDKETENTSTRNRVLKELHLARALYRCGDKDGLGTSVLKAYTEDLHNHYARHASEILEKS